MPCSQLPPQPENGVWKAPNAPVVMTFGAEGFFGYSPASSGKKISDAGRALPEYGPEAMWWSTFEETEEPKDTKNFDKNIIREQLIERHKDWKDPVVQHCINNAEISLLVPAWITPKLPKWHTNGVILIGDAAHGTFPKPIPSCIKTSI
jgi:2-polyprenyl-6-methoxyphenol hydroxylase-like FAD-dependent oxidoreductase